MIEPELQPSPPRRVNWELHGLWLPRYVVTSINTAGVCLLLTGLGWLLLNFVLDAEHAHPILTRFPWLVWAAPAILSAIGAIGLCLGIWLVARDWRLKRLLTYGIAVEGQIQLVMASKDEDGAPAWFIDYTFIDLHGLARRSRCVVYQEPLTHKFTPGSAATVLYLPQDPREHVLYALSGAHPRDRWIQALPESEAR
ncbi:MAG: hypothetical protein EXR62_12035 [Chloroflexi bacterium]|nr:hypothetical protein [Chloroflexota bacterium]